MSDQNNNAFDRAIEIVGSQSELARALNTTPGAVTNWIARGKIPAERCLDIESLTDGAVSAADLRTAFDDRG